MYLSAKAELLSVNFYNFMAESVIGGINNSGYGSYHVSAFSISASFTTPGVIDLNDTDCIVFFYCDRWSVNASEDRFIADLYFRAYGAESDIIHEIQILDRGSNFHDNHYAGDINTAHSLSLNDVSKLEWTWELVSGDWSTSSGSLSCQGLLFS